MAKILNGILGGGAGKVGGVVMSNWKGIDTLRAYSVPANPNTTAQQTQRSKFAAVTSFVRLILSSIIQNYWDPFAVEQSGFNAAMSANLLAWSSSVAFDDAIVAQGNLELDEMTGATYNNTTGAVEVDWTAAALGNGLGTDYPVAVIVDTANNVAFVSDANTTRANENDSFNIGAGRTVADLKAYLFFYRGAGDTLEVSNSDFFQVTAP